MNSTQFIAAAVTALVALSGCSGKLIEGKKIDYKSAAKVNPLAVPPDLSAPPTSDRYTIPETSAGSATYSEYSEGQGARHTGPTTAPVVMPASEKVRIERGGSQRWLVVESDAETLWPAIREFWQDTGFLIDRELPDIGIMETDWAENRAKIPESALRKLIGKVIDQAYSYPERDKFRTRLERGEEPGTTEIYISHRGAYQVVVGEHGSEQVKWQMRPTDPELEAEMLSRLMRKLGAKEEQVQARAPVAAPRAQMAKNGEIPEALMLADSFDHAWRRVGLALDRVGFTVEDRDRSKGLYYVRYLDPDIDGKGKSGGGWSRLAFWRSNDAKKDEQFRISVADVDKGTEVRVQNAEGATAKSPTAGRILALLQEELK